MTTSHSILDVTIYTLFLILSLDVTVRGFLIISKKKKILLIPFQILFYFIRIIRGSDLATQMKAEYQQSKSYRRYGWYALVGGPLSIILLIILIIDAVVK